MCGALLLESELLDGTEQFNQSMCRLSIVHVIECVAVRLNCVVVVLRSSLFVASRPSPSRRVAVSRLSPRCCPLSALTPFACDVSCAASRAACHRTDILAALGHATIQEAGRSETQTQRGTRQWQRWHPFHSPSYRITRNHIHSTFALTDELQSSRSTVYTLSYVRIINSRNGPSYH